MESQGRVSAKKRKDMRASWKRGDGLQYETNKKKSAGRLGVRSGTGLCNWETKGGVAELVRWVCPDVKEETDSQVMRGSNGTGGGGRGHRNERKGDGSPGGAGGGGCDRARKSND